MPNKNNMLFSPLPKACVRDGMLYLDGCPVRCVAFTIDKNYQRDIRSMALATIMLHVDLGVREEMAHETET